MRSADVLAAIGDAVRGRHDVVMSTRELVHACGTFAVMRIASRDLEAAGPVVFVQAGLHGDETAGPIALARHLGEIFDDAHGRGLRLIVYPLVNPSGFDARTRYNGDHDRGTAGNGDLLRYVRDDGAYVDEVPPSTSSPRWVWSSDTGQALPAETRVLHAMLRAEPLSRVVAALDLHQDCLTPGLGPASYAYAFGEAVQYASIVREVRALVPVLAHTVIGAGFGVEIDAHGAATKHQSDSAHPASDGDGLIVRHDGSLTDLFFRLGARASVAVETTGATPLDVACAVNMIWIRGMLALAAR